MTDIPDWAIRRFCEGAGLNYNQVMSAGGEHAVTLRVTVRHGASIIAKHEQPPVDPDEEAVKRIFAAYNGISVEDAHFITSGFARTVSQYKQEKANG